MSSKEDIGFAFILCDFKSRDETEDLLASMLKQLLRLHKIPPRLQELFQKHSETEVGGRSSFSVPELIGYLDTVISSYSRTFVIIDALDEYETGSRDELLETIFHLQKTTKLSFLATSRPILEIISMFEESDIERHVVEIQAEAEDLRTFLGGRMRREMKFMRKVSEPVKEEIVSEIVAASGGMFLLAELYLNSIKGCRNVDSVRKAVQNLPKGIDAYQKLYADTMKRIEAKETRDIALCVLCWVSWARRPVTLLEVQHAFLISEGGESLNADNTTDEEAMLSACEGLVTNDHETNILRLIHYTTREYLESVRHSFFPTADGDILQVCLDLLSNPTFGTGGRMSRPTPHEYEGYEHREARIKERLAKYPLVGYAATNWGHHAHSCDATLEEKIIRFLQLAPNVDVANETMRTITWNSTGLHLAVFFGLGNTTEQLLSRGHCNPDDRDGYGESALLLAARKGNITAVRTLLAHNADVDSVANVIGQTTLSRAAQLGFLDIVKILESHGADLNSKDHNGQSPLYYAAKSGQEHIVQYLLSHDGPRRHIDDQVWKSYGGGQTALWNAVKSKHWGVAKLLMAYGARLDVKDFKGDCLLTWMVSYDQYDDLDAKLTNVTELIEILGADVNSADATGQTALARAAKCASKPVLEYLLSAGADPTIASHSGWTPLMHTCAGAVLGDWDEVVDVVDMLLQHDPDSLTRQNSRGETAFAIVARRHLR